MREPWTSPPGTTTASKRPTTLQVGAGTTVHFNSDDLAGGNPRKGVAAGIGSSATPWRLELRSALHIEVFVYARTTDGFLTTLHDVAPSTEGRSQVVVFNPARNVNQASSLRLANPANTTATVTVTGTDDAGRRSDGEVTVALPPRGAIALTAQELEGGAWPKTDGALGTGTGKWRLQVSSSQPIHAMSLLTSPTGHVTNLSSSPVPLPDRSATAPQVLVGEIRGNTATFNAAAEFDVRLVGQPSSDVTIAVHSSDEQEGVPDQDRVVFTPTNAFAAQTVVVRGRNADAAGGGQDYEIVLGDTSSSDPDFHRLAVPDVRMRGVVLDVSPPTGATVLVAQLPAQIEPAVTYTGDGVLSFTLSEPPAGMTIDPTTGRIEWSPAPTDAGGNFNVTVAATDGTLSSSASFIVAVVKPRPVSTEVAAAVLTVTDIGTDLSGMTITATGDGGPGGTPGASSANAAAARPRRRRPCRRRDRAGSGRHAGAHPGQRRPPHPTHSSSPRRTGGRSSSPSRSPIFPRAAPSGTSASTGSRQPTTCRDGSGRRLSWPWRTAARGGSRQSPSRCPGSTGSTSSARRSRARPQEPPQAPKTSVPAWLARPAHDLPASASAASVTCNPDDPAPADDPGDEYRKQRCTYGNAGLEVTVHDFGTSPSATNWHGTTRIEEMVAWLVDIRPFFDELELDYDDQFSVEIFTEGPNKDGNITLGYVKRSEDRKTLHLNNYWTIGESRARTTTAHEYFHQAQSRTEVPGFAPLIDRLFASGDWMIEGSARWFEDRFCDGCDTYMGSGNERFLEDGLHRADDGLSPYRRFAFIKLVEQRCDGLRRQVPPHDQRGVPRPLRPRPIRRGTGERRLRLRLALRARALKFAGGGARLL